MATVGMFQRHLSPPQVHLVLQNVGAFIGAETRTSARYVQMLIL